MIKKIPKKPHDLIFPKIPIGMPKRHRKPIGTRSFVPNFKKVPSIAYYQFEALKEMPLTLGLHFPTSESRW